MRPWSPGAPRHSVPADSTPTLSGRKNVTRITPYPAPRCARSSSCKRLFAAEGSLFLKKRLDVFGGFSYSCAVVRVAD